jgi:hypothetical protein
VSLIGLNEERVRELGEEVCGLPHFSQSDQLTTKAPRVAAKQVVKELDGKVEEASRVGETVKPPKL